MKQKIVAVVGLLLVAGLTFTLCWNRDVPSSHPDKFVSGLWSSADDGMVVCDVHFSANRTDSNGGRCLIILSGDDETKTGVFAGTFLYDPLKNRAAVQFDASDGDPSGADLQFDSESRTLSVSFTPASSDYGTYQVVECTYPKAVAGRWNNGPADGCQLVVDFGVYDAEKHRPCTISNIEQGDTTMLTGSYTYNPRSGEGGFTVAFMDCFHQGTFSYDRVDGKLNLQLNGIGFNDKLSRVLPAK